MGLFNADAVRVEVERDVCARGVVAGHAVDVGDLAVHLLDGGGCARIRRCRCPRRCRGFLRSGCGLGCG